MEKLKETTSILFSTHVLHDAEEICEDIFIIKGGKVIVEGNLKELQKKYQRPTIYLETEQPLDQWCYSLKKMDWIRNMNGNEYQLTITVKDIDEARDFLISNDGLRKLKLVNFEVVKTTLEDLFMEVTKE
ncbi:ABC-type uncharacterized transport system ATPase subunit [Evansella vedderi]|uniref:ABC-type uncharacterized transport system ATPase subunit n=1 Tax=Evansella vedderi TaxID=38282 RepID=A0ABT9ZYR5_9BACI|nr:DUF4162 domain-containing protein [Evansella vedderi]MDQ0255836.1 ABC-type uncharacterized transport system ATPase subunit [Evansella vedderi]